MKGVKKTMFMKIPRKTGKDSTSEISSILYQEDLLETYLSSDDWDLIPLLIGPTSVAKNVLIEKIADKLGYRLVYFRTALLDKPNTEIFTKIEVLPDGKRVWTECPFASLLECSDEFIEYCEESLKLVGKRLVSENLTDKEKGLLTRIKGYLEEKIKPPLLFFDDIGKATESALNLLTDIFSLKLSGYSDLLLDPFSISRARVISSITTSIDSEESNLNIYVVKNLIYKTLLTKILRIIMSPEDAYILFSNWATKKDKNENPNIHPIVWKYLQKNSKDVYDNSDILVMYKQTQKRSTFSTTQFPSYRSWEFISQYLYKIDSQREKKFLPQIIEGSAGRRIGRKFVEFLSSEGYSQMKVTGKGEIKTVVEHSLLNNIPTLIVCHSKEDNIPWLYNFANEMGAEVILFDLSQADNILANWSLIQVNTLDFILKEARSEELSTIDVELYNQLYSLLTEREISSSVVIRSPYAYLDEKIKEAREKGKEIIIFLDKIERLRNEVILASIFEAMSNYNFLGVDFSDIKDRVKIIAFYNLDNEYRIDKNLLDPTFVNRFMVYRCEEN